MGGLNRGMAGPPLTRLARADSSPARKRGGASKISTAAKSTPAAARSAMAARSRSCSRGLRCRYRPTAVEPTASAASCRPSRTRCGEIHSSDLSLSLAGSPSAPFPMTTGFVPARRDRGQLPVHRERRPAAAGEPGGLEHRDQPPGLAGVRRVAEPLPVGPQIHRHSSVHGEQPGQPGVTVSAGRVGVPGSGCGTVVP